MAEFKFQIGDVVIHKSAITDCMLAATMGQDKVPICFTITERIAQECPSGVQLKYTVSGEPRQHLEHEFARPEEFDATACRAVLESVWDKRDAAKEEAKHAWRLAVELKRNPQKPLLDLMQQVKEELVGIQDWECAAKVRDVMDEVKAEQVKRKAESAAADGSA